MPQPNKPSAPFIPASKSLPELTAAPILLAIILSVVMAGANAYLGLFAGMTVSAAIPAAVISMALLKLIGGNILQNNGVQTAASAGESVAAGVAFTIPALLLLGVWDHVHYWETTILAGLGGLLGVLFTIPLRRALIIEQPLTFPEGVATAEVLKLAEGGDQGSDGQRSSGGGFKSIAIATVLGAVFKLGATGLRLWRDTAAVATHAGGSVFYFGSNLSPALLAVGYIVGLNIAVLVFIGGAINWLVAIPIYAGAVGLPGAESMDAVDYAGAIWSAQTRYLGVGAMLVGGIFALVRLAPSLLRGIRASVEAHRAARTSPEGGLPRTERDIPIRMVFGISAAALLPLTFVFYRFSGSVSLAVFMGLFVVVAGFLFSAVAAYMAGLVGSSNNPISGVTIATVLTGALLLRLLGADSTLGPACAIFIGAAVCSAAALGGDNMQDLKAGHILGATPWKQQVMQIIGVVSAVFFMAPIFNLLNSAYGIGSDKLAAPQAGLMASVAGGIFSGDLPWLMIGIGAGIAVLVIVLDLILEARGATFRTPVLALAVGIYLPFDLSVPIFAGGILATLAKRTLTRAGKSDEDIEAGGHRGLVFSAGLITGEALMGILLAIPIVVSEKADVLAVVDTPLMWPGLLLIGGLMVLLYRTVIKRSA